MKSIVRLPLFVWQSLLLQHPHAGDAPLAVARLEVEPGKILVSPLMIVPPVGDDASDPPPALDAQPGWFLLTFDDV